MRIVDLLKEDTIITPLLAKTKEGVIDELIDLLAQADRLNNKAEMRAGIMAREQSGSTGIGEGIAIPHAKTAAVKIPSIAFGYSPEGIDYQSLDGQKVHLFFMIAATADADQAHLETLARLAEMLMDEEVRKQLMAAKTKTQIRQVITDKEKQLDGGMEIVNKTASTGGKVVAVTACPTGIAHTYMAADALKKKADELGIGIKVETNGSGGVKHRLTEEDIQEAAAVIVAADKQVEMERFVGKVLIQVPVAEGIRNPEGLLKRAIRGDAPVYKQNLSYTEKISRSKAEQKGKRSGFYRHLMSGVSNMLPFVIGGGILIAICFMFGIHSFDPKDPSYNHFAKVLMDIGGGTAFKLMIPVLAGYIAMSIADRPGLAPGMVGGLIAADSGSGFLGGLIAGFLAGYIVEGLKKLFARLPVSLEGIKPMLLYPLLGIFFTGMLMVYVIAGPVADLNVALGDWLKNMGQANAVILGVVLGAMMAFDMGGPVNKACYTFGLAMIANGNYYPHAAIMAAGMTPPLGLALATTFFKSKFTQEERNAGKTAYILGLSFITEGAIPFAAADPARVIPSTMAGSAVAGGLSMFFGCTLPAPHGGIFVLPVIGHAGLYVVAIVMGAVVTAVLANLLKKKVVE